MPFDEIHDVISALEWQCHDRYITNHFGIHFDRCFSDEFKHAIVPSRSHTIWMSQHVYNKTKHMSFGLNATQQRRVHTIFTNCYWISLILLSDQCLPILYQHTTQRHSILSFPVRIPKSGAGFTDANRSDILWCLLSKWRNFQNLKLIHVIWRLDSELQIN